MTKLLVWLLAACSIATLAWAGHRYWLARADANLAMLQLQRVTADVNDIAALRTAAPPESRRPRPTSGLGAKIGDVIAKAGLPQSCLQSLSPETESPVGNAGLRRQLAKLTLEGLTLPELGAWLAEWRTAQPQWTVASIEITPASQRVSKATERPLRALIGIETVFGTTEGGR
jgi:hypothetical protein